MDCGGVARDLFSRFWEEATKKLFDGCNLLTLSVRPEVDVTIFPIMGGLLSHGFLTCSYLPVVLAFPTLVGALIGPTTIVPDSILLEAIADFLSEVESKVIQEHSIYIDFVLIEGNIRKCIMIIYTPCTV